jgi:hypothetical protein
LCLSASSFKAEGRTNQTFESLSLSPSGQSLLTANEGYLSADGETSDGSDRILRYENRRPNGFFSAQEFYYLADPGLGVVEIVALSEDELLVMERGFYAGVGNTKTIYRVSLEGAKDVSKRPSLGNPLGEQPLGLLDHLLVHPAQEISEFVVLGEPSAPRCGPAPFGSGQEGVECLLSVVARFMCHCLTHLDRVAFVRRGGIICDEHIAGVKRRLQDGYILAQLVNCLTQAIFIQHHDM